MSAWDLYNRLSESKRASETPPVQLSTSCIHPGEDHHKVNQKMGLVTYFSLCFLGLLIANPFLEAEASSCARQWLQNQGNCYAYFDNKLTWQEAEIECQSYGRGAHLASVLTKAETFLVAQHISTYQRDLSNVWIGLHDVHQNRKWRWADESTYNYKAWINDQPDNYGNIEYCVELVLSTGFTEWNDVPCQMLNAYICKYEL
ncbi:C-type lectin BpLec-like [Candoia aspera]|uniref:C-type lectin BpLec-like n=1 Tax=Candoia aspera TaxID=51853 RepID=UPI002FD7C56D